MYIHVRVVAPFLVTKCVLGDTTDVGSLPLLTPLKSDVLVLQVLQQLPSKSDIIEKVSMAIDQQELYDGLIAKFNATLNEAKTETRVRACDIMGRINFPKLLAINNVQRNSVNCLVLSGIS